MKKLLCLLAFLLILEDHALAQRSGAGQFAGPNACGDVIGQIAQQTYCFDWATGSLNVWSSGYLQISGSPTTGYFVNNATVRGLLLSGIGAAGALANSNGESSLQIGAVTLSTAGSPPAPGELNVTSGFNPVTNTVDATGAAYGTMQVEMGYGPWFGIYWSNAIPIGSQVQWNPTLEAWGYSVYPVHLENPIDAPVPWVTSGQLAAGSRDSFGWIVNVTGGQTTLTFGTPFYGSNSVCTLSDAGQPNLWYPAWQSNVSVTFVCVLLNGQPCPDLWGWVEYHCAGLGS